MLYNNRINNFLNEILLYQSCIGVLTNFQWLIWPTTHRCTAINCASHKKDTIQKQLNNSEKQLRKQSYEFWLRPEFANSLLILKNRRFVMWFRFHRQHGSEQRSDVSLGMRPPRYLNRTELPKVTTELKVMQCDTKAVGGI